jgi:hypothetical protein
LVAAAIGLALPFLTWRVAPVVEEVVDPSGGATRHAPKHVLRLQPVRIDQAEAVLALELPPAPNEYGLKGPPPAKTVNYLFVNPDTGATRWLFPTHQQVIAATDYVTPNTIARGYDPPTSERALAVVYDVLPGDPTAKPGKRKYQVYVSKPNGTDLTRVLENLDEQPEFLALTDDKIFFQAVADGRSFVATVSLAELKLVMQKDITDLAPR